MFNTTYHKLGNEKMKMMQHSVSALRHEDMIRKNPDIILAELVSHHSPGRIVPMPRCGVEVSIRPASPKAKLAYKIQATSLAKALARDPHLTSPPDSLSTDSLGGSDRFSSLQMRDYSGSYEIIAECQASPDAITATKKLMTDFVESANRFSQHVEDSMQKEFGQSVASKVQEAMRQQGEHDARVLELKRAGVDFKISN